MLGTLTVASVMILKTDSFHGRTAKKCTLFNPFSGASLIRYSEHTVMTLNESLIISHTSSGAIPASMIPTPIPIPADLFDSDSDSSHLGYDSDSDSNTIFMNDSDSIPTPALLIFLF